VGAGPLFPLIQDDLETSHAVVGLLATVPVLCMGLFAPTAGWWASMSGTRLAITVCLSLIAVSGLVRALAADATLVILLTFPIGLGMGVAGAVIPVAIKERFPDRPGFAMGVYATGIQTGSGLASLVAVPVAHVAGGWRASLAAFSAVTVGLLVGWVLLTRGDSPIRGGPLERPPIRSGVGWLLVAAFGLMGLVYYGLTAWLPASYVERGWSEASAGVLLGVLNIAAIPGALLVPWLSDRAASRRRFLIACGLLLIAGLLGLVAPGGTYGAYVSSAVVGFAIGSMFPLVLTLPLDLEDQPPRVAALVGMMLGVGYTGAALSPVALGAIRDATGTFTQALWILLLLGVLWALTVTVLPLSGSTRGADAPPQVL
jgi:MFS transporter, CP family, cyanate transporter